MPGSVVVAESIIESCSSYLCFLPSAGPSASGGAFVLSCSGPVEGFLSWQPSLVTVGPRGPVLSVLGRRRLASLIAFCVVEVFNYRRRRHLGSCACDCRVDR